MTTTPLTISVDPEAARAFAVASDEERRRIESLLSLRLRELVSAVDQPHASASETPRVQNRLATLRRARGIWRDRDDLRDPEELRREWDRF